jgi:single-strand DNA-binding protein
MGGSVNKVILIGHLGKDPETRSSQNGGQVCNLSLATSESWTDKQTGERREKTEWHRVVIFNERVIKFVDQYARKGSKAYVEGELRTRKWTDQGGIDRFSTEVVISQFRGDVQLLSRSDDGADADSGAARAGSADRRPASGGAGRPGSMSDQYSPPTGSPVEDDEVPF